MNKLAFALVLALTSVSTGFAAQKTYQVTGPVLEVSDSAIVVQKGKDRWELKLDASTKSPTKAAVGDKVTVEYTMTATDIEVKPAKKKK